MTKLCQTLIVRKGRVLLGTWKKGPFAGRVTGLLGKAKFDQETPEMVSQRKCLELAQVTIDPRLVSRRALFAFIENDKDHPSARSLGEEYVETQLIYNADVAELVGGVALGKPTETDEFVPKWYALDKLPFKDMPEDDEWWYPRVLEDQERLFGEFVFIGSALQSHEVKSVTAASGDLLHHDSMFTGGGANDVRTTTLLESELVREISRHVAAGVGEDDSNPKANPNQGQEDQGQEVDGRGQGHGEEEEEEADEKEEVPVVLHNSNCSKSRALLRKIEAANIVHRVRDYVADPLTLSELECVHVSELFFSFGDQYFSLYIKYKQTD
jgi:8-oxo-dGTP diphosphatase